MNHSGSSGLFNFTESQGDDTAEKSLLFQLGKGGNENDRHDCLRMTANQVRFLETSFEVEDKLEPDRKLQLAKETGLQPRQVAIWFRNRRARYKAKQLENDYGRLKSNYDKIVCDTVLKENEELKNKVDLLTEQLLAAEKGRITAQTFGSEQTLNLSKLTNDLLLEIAKRLKKFEDFTCFRCVSKSLRLCVKEEYFEGLRIRKGTPYLMLPPVSRDDGTNDDVRELYSLVEGESTVASLEVPMFRGSKTCMCFESLGWLLTVEFDGRLRLFDPFSGTEVPVPHLDTLFGCDLRFEIKKMVLSARPNEGSDFILMIAIGYPVRLAFWRLGDKEWKRIYDLHGCFRDVVYDSAGKQFYAISAQGIICVINLDPDVEFRIIMGSNRTLSIVCSISTPYIVKTKDGTLLAIKRIKERVFYLTHKFQVYKIEVHKFDDEETSTWTEIHNLGNMAIFVGRNSSIAVDATSSFSPPRGGGGGVIKGNHIYFTDEFTKYQVVYSKNSRKAKVGSVDSGVYNLETGAIERIDAVEPLLSDVCPAIWITPNLGF